jgi:hypothetical protein
MNRLFAESIDVRDSNRYERVKEGTGKGGCGEVGTIWTGVGYRIISRAGEQRPTPRSESWSGHGTSKRL